MSMHEQELNHIMDQYFKTSISDMNNDHIFFDTKFNKLHDQFNVLNEFKLKKFIIKNDEVLLLIYEIIPLLKKYFPKYEYSLRFDEDPEFESLNLVSIYIDINDSHFDKEWILLEQLINEIDDLDEFSFAVKKFVSVSLW